MKMREKNLEDAFSRFVAPETELLKTMELRDLHKELTEYLYKSKTKEEFTIGFIYKNLIEDILKNLSEDDYVENSKAKEVIRKICLSINYYLKYKTDKTGWLEKLFDVSADYKELHFSRFVGSEIFVKGPKRMYLFSINAKFRNELNNEIISKKLKDIFKAKRFSISENSWVKKRNDDKWKIIDGKRIYTVEKKAEKLNIYTEIKAKLFVADSGDNKIFSGENLDYDIFPLLDRNLTDPDFSKPICDWYLHSITKLKEDGKINALCLIEKEYSNVGGLGMLSQLVYELELPLTIYRAAYWDKDAKFSGAKLTPNSKTVIVFDVMYSGRMILEVARFLKQYFGAETKVAVVFFDFEKGKANLEKEGIGLFSYLRFSEIEEQIKAKLPFVKKSREVMDNIVFGDNYEESEREIKNLLTNHVLK